jgi:hypothetical protein
MITNIYVHTITPNGRTAVNFYHDPNDESSRYERRFENITRSSVKRLEKIFQQKNGMTRIYIYTHGIDLFFSPV